ncbi:MAG: hypothetical protein ABIZ05_09240 [Pseudonocardiaceae bacterium]
MKGNEDRTSFSPDGLTEQTIDALLSEVDVAAGAGRSHVGVMSLTDVPGTRPGGPNRQERAHWVGAPESPTEAIKEIDMLPVHTCVGVHCAQCGDSPDSVDSEAYWPAEDAALEAAAAQGWRVGPSGRLWCSACAPCLTCEAEGHDVSGWRRPITRDGGLACSEYRHCRRCCLHESRPAVWLISAGSGSGKTSAIRQWPLAAAAVVGEVA